MNRGIGLSRPAPSRLPDSAPTAPTAEMPVAADPPARLR